jgi:hypothetical protein
MTTQTLSILLLFATGSCVGGTVLFNRHRASVVRFTCRPG